MAVNLTMERADKKIDSTYTWFDPFEAAALALSVGTGADGPALIAEIPVTGITWPAESVPLTELVTLSTVVGVANCARCERESVF
jgi:hypothetical protein